MLAYALVAYLDNEAEAAFKHIWANLSEDNITDYGITTKGKRPHITLADYDNLDKSIFINLLNNYYEDKAKVDICLSILGTFINTGTLFIAPALSAELTGFHKAHHEYFNRFNDNENSLYLPGRWSPHCTVASRLSEEKMVQAFRFCRSNISKIYGKLSEVALIEVEFNEAGIAIEDKVIFSRKLK